jgi:hypothetical protein
MLDFCHVHTEPGSLGSNFGLGLGSRARTWVVNQTETPQITSHLAHWATPGPANPLLE